MRIVHLTPGTGSFHCGSCLRDNALIKALRVRKHDAIMVPLYLPLVTDHLAANPEIDIQVGGVSLYLAQKMPWTRHLPRFIHRWLNKPERLRNASKKMGMTAASTLGEMTLGSLQGKGSTQWSEWQRLIEWLKTQPKPHVISLSNSLLCGLVPTLTEEFPESKIVVSLQGEDSFLDSLPDPYKEQCWEALRASAGKVTLFVSPSQFYADLMNRRLGLDGSQMRVVPNGMDLHSFPTADPDPNFPTIGYFARMIHGKGLTMVVDAFIALAKKGTVPRLKLRIGGAYTAADEEYVNGLKQKIADAGLTQRVEWLPNLSFNEKVRFFRELSVFTVPATYGEAFGLYVIEAMASGVPVVQPHHGAFPEIIDATKGGVLCKPDDLESLTSALEELLIDHNKRDQLANDGIPRVRDEYSATKMAERFEAILQ